MSKDSGAPKLFWRVEVRGPSLEKCQARCMVTARWGGFQAEWAPCGKGSEGEECSRYEELRKASVGAGAWVGAWVGMGLGCSAGVSPTGCCQLGLRIFTSQVFLFRKTQGWDRTALAGFQPKS